MNIPTKILVSSLLLILSYNTSAQTRNVVANTYEADSIERANFLNKNFHSEIKNFCTDADTTGFNCISGNTICITPIVELSAGYSTKDKDELHNAIIGASGIYHYKNKLTFQANILTGNSKPLESKAMLADSLGYFPEFGNFKKHGDSYNLKYFEFYANYLPIKNLMLSAGKGKKSLGEGYRSVLLSQSNSGMYYFDTRVNAGSFNYTFSINGSKSLDTDLEGSKTKWVVYHWVSWNATKWLNLGGFEAVTLTRRDTVGNSRFVDLHYINPVLFTRPIEYSLGSPDNELMGVFGKIKFLKSHCIFGQFMLDEFKIENLKDKSGWWANKYAIEAGAKGFVGNFSYLLEVNYIRPYMYSHWNAIESYAMYSQPLANPYGGNLKEFLAEVKYQKREFGASLLLDFVEMGKDFSNQYSLGNNILRSYNDRENDYGNHVGQGNNSKLVNITASLRYQPKMLKGLCAFSQLGVQKNNGSNAYVLLGVRTNQIYFDKSR